MTERLVPNLTSDVLLLSGVSSAEDQMSKGFLARPDSKRWPISFPINWKADPFKDNNWKFNLSAWRVMDALILEDLNETGEGQYFETCLEIALDWYEFNIVSNNNYTMRWYDMAVGLRALRLAFLLDRICKRENDVNSSIMSALRHLADTHLEKLLIEDNIALNNHGIFQMVGLYVLSDVYCDVTERAKNVSFCSKMMSKIVEHNFTSEGVQKEASPEYHRYVTQLFLRLSRGTPLGGEFNRLFRSALQLVPYMTQPNGHFPAIGDTQGDKPVDVLKSVPEKDKVKLGSKKIVVKDLSRSGYIIARSEPEVEPESQMMLFLTGMAYTSSHKHADELSFTYFANGQPIFIDPGKYAYQYDEKRNYVLSASAHNNISLKDSVIFPRTIESFSGSFLQGVTVVDDFLLLRGEIRRPGFFSHERRIRLYSDGKLRVMDHVINDSKDALVSSLHLAPGLVPTLVEGGFEIELNNERRLVVSAGDNVRLEALCGEKEPMLGWHSPSFKTMSPNYVLRMISEASGVADLSWNISIQA